MKSCYNLLQVNVDKKITRWNQCIQQVIWIEEVWYIGF